MGQESGQWFFGSFVSEEPIEVSAGVVVWSDAGVLV